MYDMICNQTHILYIISIHSWTFLYIIQSKCRSMLWTGQCLKPRTQERYGSHCLRCGIWRHQHVESHGQGTLHWEKMWDRTDRTSKFLSRIAYINFDRFQSHDLGKMHAALLSGEQPISSNAWGRCAFGDNLPGNTWGTLTAKSLLLHMWSVLISHYYSTIIMNSAHRSGIEGRDPRHLQRQALSFWQLVLVLQKCCMIDSDEPYYSPHLRETTENDR